MERSSFVQELLDEHIFIKYENEVYLYRKDLFRTMNLCDTYNNSGFIIGHENAGDNHPDNRYSELYDVWKHIAEQLTEEDNYDVKYNEFCEKFKDQFDYIQCTAHNYWNGSNFNTLLLSSDNPNFTVEEQLTEEEAAEVAAIIEQAIDEDDFVSIGGSSKAQTEQYIVEKDIAWTGSPQTYSVINTESADFFR